MIVLDASALVDVVLGLPTASWVLDQIDAEPVSAPALQSAEVLSALARLVRAGTLDATAGRDALDAATALPQALVPSSPQLLRRAWSLRESIRILDGLYVALAEDLRCPLVTTDLRLARSPLPCEVLHP